MLSVNYCWICQQITPLTICIFNLLDKSKEFIIAVLISQYILLAITETHIDYKGKYKNIDVL